MRGMKIFVPFEEALVDDLVRVGEAIVPFKLEFQRGRVTWDQVEVLEDTVPRPVPGAAAALAAVD